MNIQIKGTNLTLTDDIRDYLNKKLVHVEKFIEKKEGVIMDVELAKTTNHHRAGDVFRAEIMVTGNHMQVRAVSEKDDLYKAIDDAKDEIVRELTSKHEKRISTTRRAAVKLKNILKGITRRR
jgi:putative sigma-54 modulation protein